MSSRPSTTHYASSSSTDTDSSSPSSSDTDLSIRYSMDVQPVASVEIMRCLRCHRHVEATSTDDPATTGMIRVGFNLYYCQKYLHGSEWSPFASSGRMLHQFCATCAKEGNISNNKYMSAYDGVLHLHG
ncbi:hypothetical protein F4819DRAFT_491636 [Hypoxylon fuscum]|nr:hypothetical protein F4819DRAFT_491636 [Hypoxylon fuscum]